MLNEFYGWDNQAHKQKPQSLILEMKVMISSLPFTSLGKTLGHSLPGYDTNFLDQC